MFLFPASEQKKISEGDEFANRDDNILSTLANDKANDNKDEEEQEEEEEGQFYSRKDRERIQTLKGQILYNWFTFNVHRKDSALALFKLLNKHAMPDELPPELTEN